MDNFFKLHLFFLTTQKTSGLQKRRGEKEATHKETSQCIYVVYEGNESKSCSRMHIERERSHQSNPWSKGRLYLHVRAMDVGCMLTKGGKMNTMCI